MPAGLLKKDDLKATAEGLPYEEEEEESGSEAKLGPVIGGAFMAISLNDYPKNYRAFFRILLKRVFF